MGGPWRLYTALHDRDEKIRLEISLEIHKDPRLEVHSGALMQWRVKQCTYELAHC
jgi:hypothetical protein